MKLLLFGGYGQAGTAFRPLAERRGFSVDAPRRDAVDVRDTMRVTEIIRRYQPRWVVNFTAFHVLEACEEDFGSAIAVNAVAVRAMALAARHSGARFLTVSTDYVFGGEGSVPWRENDDPYPLQAYGVSKRAGELAALAVSPDHSFIVRTCGLYGPGGSRGRGGNFIEKRLTEARTEEQIEVGSDLRCTPTSADAFAAAVLSLLAAPHATPGIYHLTAAGACSWAEFAAYAFQLSGCSCRVIPVDRKGDYGPVRRPANSVLENTRARALGITLPSWQDDLAAYLHHRASNCASPE
jgi:dTDP-4-dehydrorhamnose reductase